jgi:uncharacterized protein (TIGR03435 family)
MNRALISACLSFGLVSGIAANAQVKHSYQAVRGTVRVDDTSVPYEARIEPTTMAADSTSMQTGADTWIARGFDLKTLIAQIYDIDVRRVDVQGTDADARYDVSLSLPTEVDQDSMQRMLADALGKKFGLTIKTESRAMDVYVLSAPNGAGAELHKHVFPAPHKSALAKLVGLGSADDADDDSGRITYTGRDCSGVTSGGISVLGGTISDFQRTLEPDLDRVMLDETNLSGSYDFKIGTYVNQSQLFQLLHEQLGLVVTAAQRKVTVVAVRPVGGQNMLQAKM